MQRIFNLLLLLLCTVSALAESEIEAPVDIVIGGYKLPFDAPPYLWLSPCTQQIDGSLKHFLEYYFRPLGITPRFIDPGTESDEVNFSTPVQNLLAGKYDIAPGFFRHIDVEDIAVTEQPIIHIEEAVFYDKKRHQLQDITELTSLTGAIAAVPFQQQANPTLQFAEKHKLRYRTTASTQQGFESLFAGEVDYVIANYYRGLLLARERQSEQTLGVLRMPRIGTEFHLAYRSSSRKAASIKQVDTIIAERFNQQYIDVINEAYLKRWVNRKGCD